MTKKPTQSELQGMTVNERLGVLGLFDEWDAAVSSRDRDRMIKVLKQCAMSQEQSEQTSNEVLINPTKYGF